MTRIEPERPRGFTAWVWEVVFGTFALATMFVGGSLLIVALFRLAFAPFTFLCGTITIIALLLIRSIDSNWFPHLAVGMLGTVAFAMLLVGIALHTPLPIEVVVAILGGLMCGLSSGSTGTVQERNVKLLNDRSTELRWASITVIVIAALFGVVLPLFPEWMSVAIGGCMIVSGLLLTWRAPKIGSPHVAFATLTAAGVVGCIVPFVDVVDSSEGRFLLICGFPWLVSSAYNAADRLRDDRMRGRKRWWHPATERAAQLRESGVDWSRTLETLEKEGFTAAERVVAVRKLDRQSHVEATRFVTFYQHHHPSSEG